MHPPAVIADGCLLGLIPMILSTFELHTANIDIVDLASHNIS